MKFLIINRKNGHELDMEDTADGARQLADGVEHALDTGDLEAAYVLMSGGHAYVVDVEHSGQLAEMVRLNPLSKVSDTEIIPIAGAVEYLREYAGYLESRDYMKA